MGKLTWKKIYFSFTIRQVVGVLFQWCFNFVFGEEKKRKHQKATSKKTLPFFFVVVVVQSYAAFNKNPAAYTKGNISVF